MATTIESELLTVAEAAALLKVSKVTISRWLKEGRLAGYRVGPRAVRIRRTDVADLLKPSHGEQEPAVAWAEPEPKDVVWPEPDPAYLALIADLKPLTEEEVERQVALLEEAREAREQQRARRAGRPVPESWPLIREAREER